MAFRHDPDLAFLKHCDDVELKNLADIFVYTASGRKRLFSRLRRSETFRLAQKTGRYTAIWHDIVEEFQRSGANTLMTLLRGGRGVPYRSIVRSLCSVLRLDFNKRASIASLEETLTLGAFQRTLLLETQKERKKASSDPSLLIATRKPHWLFCLIMTAVIVLFRIQDAWLLHKTMTLPLSPEILTAVNLITGPVGAFAVLWGFFFPLCAPNERTCMIAAVYIAALRKTRTVAEDEERRLLLKRKSGIRGGFSPSFSGGSVTRASRSSATEDMLSTKSSKATEKSPEKTEAKKPTTRPVPRVFGRRVIVENEYVKS